MPVDEAAKLDPQAYRIVGPGPANPFAWPDIVEQRNEVGYHSIAVPTVQALVVRAALSPFTWVGRRRASRGPP